MSDDEAPELKNAVEIVYCPHCTLPPEYCENGPCYEKCKPWLEKNYPEILGGDTKTEDGEVKEVTEGVEGLDVEDEGDEGDGKKHPNKNRGGKGTKKGAAEEPAEKKIAAKDQYIHISKSQRNKRKFITIVKGVESFGLKAKDVAKKCSKNFACSGSVGKAADGTPEISIQGDVMLDLPSFFVSEFQIPAGKIFFKNGAKLTKAN